MNTTPHSAFLAGAALVVAVAVFMGLRVLGSPSDERAFRLDERRVSELQQIASAADLYWTRHSELPASLEELAAEPGVRVGSRDPATGEAYGYEVAQAPDYELCATFDRESRGRGRMRRDDVWRHGSGTTCFRLEAEVVERIGRPR